MRPALRALAVIAGHTVREAIGNRLTWLVGTLLLLGFVLCEFLAAVVLTETREFQAGFLAGIFRLSATGLIATFVVTSTLREFHEKGIELVLSLPIPRWVYLLGKLAGFAVVVFGVTAASTLAVTAYASWTQSAWWGISLGCELLIVTAFCLLCLLTFNQVTSALFAVGVFYVAARTIAALELMTENPLTATTGVAQAVIDAFVSGLAYLLPDLTRFAATEWLVYGTGGWSDLMPVLAQTAVYVVVLLGASLFDLYRKAL